MSEPPNRGELLELLGALVNEAISPEQLGRLSNC